MPIQDGTGPYGRRQFPGRQNNGRRFGRCIQTIPASEQLSVLKKRRADLQNCIKEIDLKIENLS